MRSQQAKCCSQTNGETLAAAFDLGWMVHTFTSGGLYLYTGGSVVKTRAMRRVGRFFGSLMADVDDIPVCQGRWVPLVGRVHGHIHPPSRGGHSKTQFGIRDVATYSKGVFRVHHTTAIPIIVSAERDRKGRITYTSVAEAKSVRERYIRVAAIDIIIRDGVRNICVASTHKKLVCSTIRGDHNKQKSYHIECPWI